MTDSPPSRISINPGGADDPVRDECFRGMQLACAGASIGSAVAAHIDSLSCVISVVAEDRAHAEQLIETIGRDLRTAVDRNWSIVKEQLTNAVSEAGHG
ncbi:MAG: hypothetical protein ACOY4R_27385 [Pseudomonadota bacterium]